MNLTINIPHQAPMRLIERIIHIDSEQAICVTQITADNIFYRPQIQGIYPWVTIEMLAQTAAVLVNNQPGAAELQLAFLMSVREFHCEVAVIPKGSKLKLQINKLVLENNIGVFSGKVFLDELCIVQSKLSAYRPDITQLAEIL